MNSVLQDILGLIKRKKTKTPQDSDYIVSASYDNPQESLKPNPIMHPALISLKAIKNWILTSISSLGSKSVGQGWVRYDDTLWTSDYKLPLLDGVEVVLSNNGGNTYKSESGLNFYDTINYKLIGEKENSCYILTVVFKASAPNANQTHLDLFIGEGDYRRLDVSLVFAKGNDEIQNFHNVYQYYVDADFVSNGAQIKIMSHGGAAEVWDVIYFIQKTYKS